MALRFAVPEDCGELLGIYADYIHTSVTFEYTLPSNEEFARRMETFGAEYPYLVWQEDNRILGYAYAHRAFERAAYQWCAEASIYLAPSARGMGLGRRMYRALLQLLQLQGVKNVYGVVTVPNEASSRLHESMGFVLSATHHHCGYKAGQWHDVRWYELTLGSCEKDPTPVIPIHRLPETAVRSILDRA